MGTAARGSRISRLASMGRRELLDRSRQYVTARIDMLRYRAGLDFPVEVTNAASEGHFFFTAADVPSLCVILKETFPAEADDIIRQAESICLHRFSLLGLKNLAYGEEIDWHYDVVHAKRAPRRPWFNVKYLDFEEVGDSKITWELNRHQHFVTLAKAYWLTGDSKFVEEIFAQWTHWRRQNPYPIGINWASSLEVGFRTLSWIWTFFLLRDCPLFTTELRKQWKNALGLNGRHIETYLSTYFSPNTHLLGEALALFFLGTLFPGMRPAERWRRRGWEILQSEAAKQVRKDGFYFEQSTYYHVYALDMFLHARILAELNAVEISPGLDQVLQGMLNALLLLGRAGVPPTLGDADGGRLFDPRRNRSEHMIDALATGAVLYQRGDLKSVAGGPREETLWLLGKKGLADFDSLPAVQPFAGSNALPDGGFYLMSDEISEQQLLIDAGPLGSGNGGHGHADALSICLVRKGRHLLMDPGTFEYVGPSGERQRLRSTSAHNTMQVDGRDQADGTGPFSWKNPPCVKVEQWITGQHFALFQGSHNGYSRLPSPVIHRRWVFQKKNGGFWLVCDVAEGYGPHQLDIAWHLGPTLSSSSPDQNFFSGECDSLALLTAEHRDWSRSVRSESWSPAYGHQESASVVHFSGRVELPADFATLIRLDESAQSATGQLLKTGGVNTGMVCGYRYSNPQQEHHFFFAHRESGPWTAGVWASDAEFLYYSVDREREEYMLVLVNGSYADACGRRVLTCAEPVRYAEVLSSAMKVEILSPDRENVSLQQSLDRVLANGDFIAPVNDSKGMGV
jgi:hypothetical protein